MKNTIQNNNVDMYLSEKGAGKDTISVAKKMFPTKGELDELDDIIYSHIIYKRQFVRALTASG